MAISQPISTDKQNNPDHSLAHRVFANDPSAPAKAVTISSTGLVTINENKTIPLGAGTIALSKLVERIYVGTTGDYATVKEAVDWFNANATVDTEILIDGGVHEVAETITVHHATKSLQIRGLGSTVTYLNATAALGSNPMFNIASNCDLNKFTANGADATGNFLVFDTHPAIYSEITDIFIYDFVIGILDNIGVNIYMFNFEIGEDVHTAATAIGIRVNYATDPGETTTLDVEIGNFTHCALGIDLLHNASGVQKTNFILDTLIFKHKNTTDIGIKYVMTDFYYGEIANIASNTFNNRGELLSGFDFTNAINSNIFVRGNSGTEDAKPHAKINLFNNATATTITSNAVYYKANFTNGSIYTTKMTLTNNKMLYQSVRTADGMMWISGALSVNRNTQTAEIAVRKEIAVTSVVGNGAIAVVTTTAEHHLATGQQVQMLGWSSATFNGVKTITVINATSFSYANAVATTPTGGTCGALLSPTSIRCGSSGSPASFSLNVYLEDISENEYFEIYVSTATSGDAVTVTDLSWLFSAV